jgi:hypothetical protein
MRVGGSKAIRNATAGIARIHKVRAAKNHAELIASQTKWIVHL